MFYKDHSAAVWKAHGRGKKRSQEQIGDDRGTEVRDGDDSLNQSGSRCEEKWLDLGYILKVGWKGFANEVNIKGREESKISLRFLV